MIGMTTPSDPQPSGERAAELAAARRWAVIAGIAGFLAVAIGAFGAHGLPDYLGSLPDATPEKVAKRIDQFDVGARYHLAHAVALLALAVWLASGLSGRAARSIRLAATMLLVGIVLFSGSLYVLVLTDTPVWGAVTPIGGVVWLAAWGWIAMSAGRVGKP